jgi:hypothetical protein
MQKDLAAVACGKCGDVRGTSMVPDGCKACRVAYVADAPRALAYVVISATGTGVGVSAAIDFQGLWTLEQREVAAVAINDALAEPAERVQPRLRLIHGGQRRA